MNNQIYQFQTFKNNIFGNRGTKTLQDTRLSTYLFSETNLVIPGKNSPTKQILCAIKNGRIPSNLYQFIKFLNWHGEDRLLKSVPAYQPSFHICLNQLDKSTDSEFKGISTASVQNSLPLQLIILQLMRNFRRTFGEDAKHLTLRDQSKERNTTISNFSHGKTNQNSRQANEQRVTKKIFEVLLKNPKESRRNSNSVHLPNTQKGLFTTIGSILNCIDNRFDKDIIDNNDVIIQVMRFWEYPQTIPKNAFQPIGAQHTWHHCLNMMGFLAELADFHFEYQAQLEDRQFEPEENDMILESVRKQDASIFTKWLDDKNRSLKVQRENLETKIQTGRLTLKNLLNSQKSVKQMAEEEETARLNLERETQNVIQQDQKNNQIRFQIQGQEEEVEELEVKNRLLDKRLEGLKECLKNQELNAEEARTLQIQIKDSRKEIEQAEKNHEKKMKALERKRLQKKQQRVKKILEAESKKLNSNMKQEERLMDIIQNLQRDTRSMKQSQKALNSKKTEIERETRRNTRTREQLVEKGKQLKKEQEEKFRENIEAMKIIKADQEQGQKVLLEMKKSEQELEAFLIRKAQNFKNGFINIKKIFDEMKRDHPDS